MYYSIDCTEEGRRCEISVKGEIVTCNVICVFEKKNKDGKVNRKYRLKGNDGIIHDNLCVSDIKFK